MQKDDLKSLVTQMYQELMESIESQNEANKEEVIIFLEDAINTISRVTDEDMHSLQREHVSFTNHYKELTDESLSHYQQTNSRFDEISKMQEEVLDEFGEVCINLPEITEKFEDIQDHMKDEISRANNVISNLMAKVKTLETNSNVDALTNVFNRRALTTYLQNVCNRDKLNHELHFLLLDIDDFKKINDTYGHVAGDKILIFIANILKKTLRDGDKVFRYGGEEFVIILNRVTNDVCMQVTQRILNIISSNQLIYKGNALNVTMSIGATIYNDSDTPETLISRADKALYKSKQNGKNQMNVELI